MRSKLKALQEADRGTQRAAGRDQVRELAHRTGLSHAAFGGAVDRSGGGEYGLGLLSAYPLKDVRVLHLATPSASSVPQSLREPRAVLIAVVQTPGPEVELLLSELEDPMRGRPFEDRWTFPTDPGVDPGLRLACEDTLVRELQVRDGPWVVRGQQEASDHYPLVAELRV